MGRRSVWEWAIVAGTLVAAAALAFHVVTLPGAPVKTATGVFYFPGCGDGPLELDGTTWYPVSPVTESDFAANPPTPGSGQGEVTIYADGRAHWVGMDGLYPTWLTTTPQDYSKVCP